MAPRKKLPTDTPVATVEPVVKPVAKGKPISKEESAKIMSLVRSITESAPVPVAEATGRMKVKQYPRKPEAPTLSRDEMVAKARAEHQEALGLVFKVKVVEGFKPKDLNQEDPFGFEAKTAPFLVRVLPTPYHLLVAQGGGGSYWNVELAEPHPDCPAWLTAAWIDTTNGKENVPDYPAKVKEAKPKAEKAPVKEKAVPKAPEPKAEKSPVMAPEQNAPAPPKRVRAAAPAPKPAFVYNPEEVAVAPVASFENIVKKVPEGYRQEVLKSMETAVNDGRMTEDDARRVLGITSVAWWRFAAWGEGTSLISRLSGHVPHGDELLEAWDSRLAPTKPLGGNETANYANAIRATRCLQFGLLVKHGKVELADAQSALDNTIPEFWSTTRAITPEGVIELHLGRAEAKAEGKAEWTIGTPLPILLGNPQEVMQASTIRFRVMDSIQTVLDARDPLDETLLNKLRNKNQAAWWLRADKYRSGIRDMAVSACMPYLRGADGGTAPKDEWLVACKEWQRRACRALESQEGRQVFRLFLHEGSSKWWADTQSMADAAFLKAARKRMLEKGIY